MLAPKIYSYAENNISKTGYRALWVLFKLLESPKSRDELINLFLDDEILTSDCSKDTITITINTLKKAGCVISRPTNKTNHKYVIKQHPFNVCFTREQVDALQSLREYIISFNDLKLLIYLNKLYFKIAHLAPDEESKDTLLYKHPLKNINFNILNELIIYSKIKKQTNICYKSPEHGEENLDFFPEYLTFENKKVNVWGFCPKYNSFSFLRVDRIHRVNLVTFSTVNSIQKSSIDFEIIVYKLKGNSAEFFEADENDKVFNQIDSKGFSLLVETKSNNKFKFYQKILSYGTDCKIVAPESAKHEFSNILKKMKAGYLNEK